MILPSPTKRKSERGNVLFYILIAVGLLASLSYAITQSNRGNTNQLEEERARIFASEILEYANVVANSVGQLRLRGVGQTSLCFDHASWGASNYNHAGCSDTRNQIFNLDGGGVTWANAPNEAMDPAAGPDNLWHFYGSNEIQNIGTTCGAASCADLVMLTDELSLGTCLALNNLVGVTNPSDAPPTDLGQDETRYTGAFSFAQVIGNEAGGAALSGQKAGCFQNTSNSKYTFYKVLIVR